MGGSASPPQPMDPGQVAGQQLAYNTQAGTTSQAGSMVNQQNPYGSLTFGQTGTGPGGIPLYTSNLQLSPQQQNLLNTLTGTKQAAGQGAQGLISGANYGSTDPTTAIGNESSGIQGGLMNQWLSSQQPWMNFQDQAEDTKLKNMGLNPSPTATNDPSTWGAYERGMGQLEEAQAMGVAGAASQFQPQAFSEASSLYQMPMQMGESLGTFGSPSNLNSSLINPPGLNVGAPNYEQAVQNYQQMQQYDYGQQQAQNTAMMQGLFGLGGGLLGI